MSEAGERILASARQALAYAQGQAGDGFAVRVPETVDIKALRRKLGLSQARFAARYGFDVGTLRNWEQGIRSPAGHAMAFLRVIEREPEAVRRALGADEAPSSSEPV